MYRTATTQSHQLSPRAGSGPTYYYASGSYLDPEGILRNSGYTRITLRATTQAVVTNWARVDLKCAGDTEESHSPPFGGGMAWPHNPVGGALQFPPTLAPRNPDGTYTKIPNEYGPSVLWNPLASAEEPDVDNNRFKNEITATVNFFPLDGLTLQVIGAGSFNRANNVEYWNLQTFNGQQQNGQGISFNSRSNYYQYQNILTYDKRLDRHDINVMGATEI